MKFKLTRKGKVLLDIKGLIMHSYHRCKDKDSTLINEQNERIKRATAGFETFLTSYLVDIFSQHAPIDVIAVWDAGNDRRRALFDEYKANRRQLQETADPMQEAQLQQLYKMVKDFLAGMGCVQVSVPGVEADDVIAYLARGIKPYTIIHTVDNDLVQLHNEHTMVIVHYQTESTAKEVYTDDVGNEVPPNLLALYKSIVGDSSDNYIGVKGMGKAAWADLVNAFGLDGMAELDEIARNQDYPLLKAVAADVGNKHIDKILASQYTWVLMYELARLHPEWCEGVYNKKLVKPVWFKRLPHTERAKKPIEDSGCLDLWHHFEKHLPVFHLVDATNVDRLLYEGDFVDDMNANPVAFDYEGYDPYEDEPEYQGMREAAKGTFVDPISQHITGASFCWGENFQKAIYITCDHAGSANVPKSVIADMLMAADQLIVHNASYEQTVTAMEFGKEFQKEHLYAPIDTTIHASYVDENDSAHLKDLARRWLRYEQKTYKQTLEEAGVSNMHEATAGQVTAYGIDDSFVDAHLWLLLDLICQVEGTADFMYDHEFYTNEVFNTSYLKGCRIHEKRIQKLQADDQKSLDELWPKLRGLLEKNCIEQNEDATKAYIEEIKPFQVASMQADGKSEQDIATKLSDITDKFRESTVYVPYEVTVVPYEFKPTVTQISAVLERLGLPARVPSEDEEEPDLNYEFYPASTAVSRISEWAVGMKAMADVEALGQQLGEPVLTKEVMEFVDLVASAAHLFKKRDGEEYKALATYASEVFKDKAKTVETGDKLNLDSPIQMAQLLYGKLALPIRHRSKIDEGSKRDELGFSGPPATNDKAIEMALAEDCREESDWRRQVLETVRAIKKIQTKFKFYYRPYPLWIHPFDGKIHPQVRNCGTVTRRPSGTSPNILQVAKGPIRSIYLPVEPGHVLVAPDFSGQELRILASESGDEVLLDAYLGENKKDIHSLTASAIMPRIARKNYPELIAHMEMVPGKNAQSYEQFQAWREDEAFKEKANFVRNKRAKGVNFLVNYEGGASTLSTNLLVPKEEAQEFIDGMFELYPKVPIFQEDSHAFAQKHGYVETAYGNRRHMLDSLLSHNDGERMRMERQASNYRIQGCAADILKVVVAECETSGLLRDTESYIMAPVYDELVCSVPIKHLVPFCQRLQKLMDVTPPGHKVPMVSEFAIGFDWYNMVEIGTDTSEATIKKAHKEALELANKAEAELGEAA